MDESDRFIPLAFAGAFLSALAFLIALFAADPIPSIAFLCACVISTWCFARRVDTSGGSSASRTGLWDDSAYESETRDGRAARVIDTK